MCLEQIIYTFLRIIMSTVLIRLGQKTRKSPGYESVRAHRVIWPGNGSLYAGNCPI